MVPFGKYAAAAKNLLKPSSAARAVFAGAANIERVDKVIKLSADELQMSNPTISETIIIVDESLSNNNMS